MAIAVLRIGHRIARDKRISTHLGLTARQFGADEIIYTGEHDSGLLSSLERIQKKWGKRLSARFASSWKSVISEYRKKGYAIAHLTMYGMPFEKAIPQLRSRNVLVIVGGEKVPAGVYEEADFNLSVGNQPHSEVAALALFLDRLSDWKSLEFNGKLKVIPSERGKHVQSRDD